MDPVTIGLLGAYAAFLALDLLRPARAFPPVRLWRTTGLLAFALYVVVASAVPLATDAFLARSRLIDATSLGTWGGAAVGLLVIELGTYAWHRLLHRVPWLFRWSHQVHHSQERHDAWGAFFFSPLDMALFTLLGSVCLVLVVGVSGEAAVVVNAVVTLLNVFQHANLRTPRWVGWFVQRPEAHMVHHERGVHAFNYSDLPLFDMLFGTYRNPVAHEGRVGFWDGASRRLGAMLLGRDVSEPPRREPAARVVDVPREESAVLPAG